MSAHRSLIVVLLVTFSLFGCAGQQTKPTNNNYKVFLGGKKPMNVDEQPEDTKTSQDYLQLGNDALIHKELQKALYYYVKALEKDNSNTLALMNIGDIHIQLGNNDVATKAFDLGHKSAPDNIDIQEKLGLSFLGESQFSSAEYHLAAVVKKDMNRSDAWNGLGVIEDVRKNFQKSQVYYAAALKLRPTSTKILNNFAYSLYLDAKWIKSEQLYLKLLSIDPAHEQGNLNYGLLLARLGKPEKALHHLQKVVTKAAALNEMGYIYYLEKRYYEAAQLFEMAAVASPTYFAQAHENLKKVERINPGIPMPNPTINSVFNEQQVQTMYGSPKPVIREGM